MLQQQTHAALRQLFLAEVHRAPTILVFEDLHWIDPASKDFLEYFIKTIDDTSLMLILVSRPIEREIVVKPLLSLAEQIQMDVSEIQLNLLSNHEGLLLVEHFVPQATEEARRLKRQIVERANGNPFYRDRPHAGRSRRAKG